jgi:O-antigen ligase
MAVFSHNGYIDALAQNGIIGIILFLLLLYNLYREILKNRKSIYFSIAFCSLISYTLMHLVQGGVFFLFDVLVVINIVATYEKEKV